MSLENEIEKRRKETYSEKYSMSIGELISLYKNDELDIHPKFQRILRWNEEKKSALIESILLRIPIPPIFVAQDDRGHWDVVDGVQRLGTIFQFAGILRDEKGEVIAPLELKATKLLPSLGNKQFENWEDLNSSLTQTQRLDFLRSRLDLEIILKESDPSSKFELFMRLNTGGELASLQEVRNCILVWSNEALYDWIDNIRQDEHFVSCTSLSERLTHEGYDYELIMRFLVFTKMKEEELKRVGNIGQFLDNKTVEIAADLAYPTSEWERIFKRTFQLLDNALASDSFRRFESSKDKFRGSFLISSFEAVAFGLGFNIDKVVDVSPEWIVQKVRELWDIDEFRRWSGIGVAASTRISRSVPIGRKLFEPQS